VLMPSMRGLIWGMGWLSTVNQRSSCAYFSGSVVLVWAYKVLNLVCSSGVRLSDGVTWLSCVMVCCAPKIKPWS